MNRVSVVPYDAAWTIEFQFEAQLIRQALEPLAATIHHIGSTSIPGMAAKPVVDMLLEVGDVVALDVKAVGIQALGYEAKGESEFQDVGTFERKTRQVCERTMFMPLRQAALM